MAQRLLQQKAEVVLCRTPLDSKLPPARLWVSQFSAPCLQKGWGLYGTQEIFAFVQLQS